MHALQENQSSNASGSSGGAGAIAPVGGKASGAASGGKGPRSCLDALWELLQQRERLQKEQPAVLAKLLQVRCLPVAYSCPPCLAPGLPGLHPPISP